MSPSSVTCVNGKLEVPNNPIIPVIIEMINELKNDSKNFSLIKDG